MDAVGTVYAHNGICAHAFEISRGMIAASVFVPSQLRGLQWLQQLTRLTLKLNVQTKESATVRLENATASPITIDKEFSVTW